MRHTQLEHCFVEYIPERLDSGVLYISMEYATAAHRCCCGCGKEVITPFTPTDWSMTFNGETVSLSPSIGNWNFSCRSHYFIRHGQVIEASTWDDEQIKSNRRKDKVVKASYYSKLEPANTANTVKPISDIAPQIRGRNPSLRKWIQKIAQWFKQS